MNVDEIILQTVNCTIARLKLSGLMKDDQQTAFQKTEKMLRAYNDMKQSHSEKGTAEKFIAIVDKALESIREEPYYDIIPMIYFENRSREAVAEYFDTTVTTISRNKRKLINKLKTLLFADDVVMELFL